MLAIDHWVTGRLTGHQQVETGSVVPMTHLRYAGLIFSTLRRFVNRRLVNRHLVNLIIKHRFGICQFGNQSPSQLI